MLYSPTGEVAEWLKAPLSKSGIRQPRIAGSNPALSARSDPLTVEHEIPPPRHPLQRARPIPQPPLRRGEVPEWPIGRAWKARVPGNRDRGFESHPLRHTYGIRFATPSHRSYSDSTTLPLITRQSP